MRLIDADKLSKTLGDIWGIPKDWDGQIEESCEDAFTAIDDAPTIEAEPVKHGRWTCDEDDGFNNFDWHCTECGRSIGYRCGNPVFSAYCPNCGAKMDGGAEQ